MEIRSRIARVILVLCAAVCFQLTMARAADSVPTVTTDKPDYPPGDTAHISGTGFLPGEQVECQVLRLDNPFDPNIEHVPWLVTADASGNFQTTWFVTSDAAGATLELTAVGQTSSLVASVMFTDAVPGIVPPLGTAPINPPAGGFAIDGNLQANTPTAGIGDWIPGPAGAGGSVLDSAGNPISSINTFHLTDAYDSALDDNFAGGDKWNDDPNTWAWVKNPVGDKVDVNNALIHVTTASNGHQWIVISGDRRSDNGDAYIDFEFLQNTLTVTTNADGLGGKFVSAGPDGGRTVNDFILTVILTSGGTTASFVVDQWKPKAGGGFDYFDVTSMISTNSVFAAVNTSDGTPVPYGAFGRTTYLKNTFTEAAVDVTDLLKSIFNPCTSLGIKTILVKTKTSQSPSANLTDMITPLQTDLTLGLAQAGRDQTKCSEGASTTFTLNGTAHPGTSPIASMAWSVVSSTAGASLDAPSSCTSCTTLPATVHVNGAAATAILRLTVTDFAGCTEHDDVVLTVAGAPACSISGSATASPSSGAYGNRLPSLPRPEGGKSKLPLPNWSIAKT